MSKPLNPTPLILVNSLRQGVRGQLKMDTKNTSIPLNTTRLILMYKVGQGVRDTHTHTELHEMMAAPSFHFRSVL